MPRKLRALPTNNPQYAAKIYFANGEEAMMVRSRVILLNKSMSGYIRDLIMADLVMARAQTLIPPPSSPALPPGYKPGDEITFFEETIQSQNPADEAAEFERLLRESEEDNKEEDLDL